MSLTLHSRFSTAEENFFSAFAQGQDALSAFDKAWMRLSSDYSSAVNRHEVDQQTITLAHATASRMAILVDALLSLDIQAEQGRQSFLTDIHGILNHPPPEDDIASSDPSSPSTSATAPPPSEPCSSSALDALSHEWLIHHLHDPYPSPVVKESIAAKCRRSVQDVSDWFADARRQIGWTALAREKFEGSRRDTSDAATLAYSEDPSNSGLSPEILRAFARIQVNAHGLCADPRIEKIGDSYIEVERSNRLLEQVSGGTELREELERAAEAYMTPPPTSDSMEIAFRPCLPSSIWTPQLSSTSYDDEENTAPSPPIAGCKRRFSASVDSITEVEKDSLPSCRPSKRRCSAPTSSSMQLSQDVEQQVTLSVPIIANVQQDIIPPIPSTSGDADFYVKAAGGPADSNPSMSSRKRRLSDAAPADWPKRPRGLAFDPRKQTASDPLPVKTSQNTPAPLGTDSWSPTSFEVDPAIDTFNLDPYTLWDVSLHSSSHASQLPATVSPACVLDVSDIDLASDAFDLSGLGSADVTSLSTFNLAYEALNHPSASPSPSSTGSASDSSDWTQFTDFIDSLASSPSSQSSQADPSVSPITSQSSNDVTDTLFGGDSSFTWSDLLSDIGEFSSLPMPLEAVL